MTKVHQSFQPDWLQIFLKKGEQEITPNYAKKFPLIDKSENTHYPYSNNHRCSTFRPNFKLFRLLHHQWHNVPTYKIRQCTMDPLRYLLVKTNEDNT